MPPSRNRGLLPLPSRSHLFPTSAIQEVPSLGKPEFGWDSEREFRHPATATSAALQDLSMLTKTKNIRADLDHGPLIIRRVDAIPVALPLKAPMTMSGVTIATAENVLVRIEAKGGAVGFGEAASAPTMTGDTLGGLVAAVRDHLAPLLVGQNALARADLMRIMARALSATPARIRRSRWRCSTSRPRARPAAHRSDRPERRSAVRPMWLLGNPTPDQDIEEAHAQASRRLPSVQAQDRREADRQGDRDRARDPPGAGRQDAALRRRQWRADARDASAMSSARARPSSSFSSSRCRRTISPASRHWRAAACRSGSTRAFTRLPISRRMRTRARAASRSS